MRRVHALAAVLTLSLFALPSCENGDTTKGPQAGAAPLVPDTLCADPARANQLCPVIPHEVMVSLNGDYNGLVPKDQTRFDAFSWQSFVALNWASDGLGNPLPGGFGDHPEAPRVWEGWTDAEVLFWGEASSGPCGLLNARLGGGRKILIQMAKNGHVVNPHASFDEAVGGPLLDRNLNFAVFEKRLNHDETQYIRDSSLVTVAGQQAIDTVNFPSGSYANDTLMTGGQVGAMEVKAAWRILQPASGDDTTRYYHREALIHVPAENSSTGIPFCIQATIGLVGLHIIHKTADFPAWVWTTFEHEDNAPTCPAGTQACGDSTVRYSFFNKDCGAACPLNTPLRDTTFLKDSSFIWNPTAPYGSRYAYGGQYGSQITRTQLVYAPTDSVNAFWLGKVGNTVWRHYRLIGSQWQAIVGGYPKADTTNAPPILGNTALESFIPNTSSCISCHTFATTAGSETKSADFSFLLGMAGQKPSMMAPFFLERQDVRAAAPGAPAAPAASPAPPRDSARPAPPAAPRPRRR